MAEQHEREGEQRNQKVLSLNLVIWNIDDGI